MNPVAKALWFISAHSASQITLEDIAASAGVSRFHLSHAFTAATGQPIMSYLRSRRLLEAARRLAAGAEDILSLALDAGYGSHEAFTRAFRDQFGVTPEVVRKQGHLDNVALPEEIIMSEAPPTKLDPPRFDTGKVLLLAGISERHDCKTAGTAIAAQWQRIGRYLGHVQGQVGQAAYGVSYNTDDAGNMNYLCGVEVIDFSALPADFSTLRVPRHKYAVFFHHEHVSAIRSTWSAVMNQWLPGSGHELVDAPCFERYDERFDPRTGNGGVEIWVPIED